MKTQININPITVNFLDKGFQNVLLPFRCFQHMVFLSFYSIQYNCIRPHRASYYVLSFIGTFVFILFHLKNLFSNEFNFDARVPQSIMIFIHLNTILLVVPFVSFYILNIVLRKDHVLLILKIQKAFRLINYKQYKKSTIRNWIGILRNCTGFIVSVALTRDLVIAIYFYTLLYFDINLTYGVSMIALIRDGIISWISEVEYYSKICLEFEEKKYEDKLNRLFQAYVSLLEAFDIFKKIFKFTTLFQTLDTFFHSLLYLYTSLELLNAGVTHYGTHEVQAFQILTILWLIKNVTFVSLFSTYCEEFYMSVREVDAVCCKLLKSLQSTVGAKRLCKNVQRLNHADFHKMTACRVFIIDGNLPQKFASLILQYAVVVLQFVLLSWYSSKDEI